MKGVELCAGGAHFFTVMDYSGAEKENVVFGHGIRNAVLVYLHASAETVEYDVDVHDPFGVNKSVGVVVAGGYMYFSCRFGVDVDHCVPSPSFFVLCRVRR